MNKNKFNFIKKFVLSFWYYPIFFSICLGFLYIFDFFEGGFIFAICSGFITGIIIELIDNTFEEMLDKWIDKLKQKAIDKSNKRFGEIPMLSDEDRKRCQDKK